jgi:hypothetical protein
MLWPGILPVITYMKNSHLFAAMDFKNDIFSRY